MEFFIGIFIAFLPDGHVVFDAAPFETYYECSMTMTIFATDQKEVLPEGAEIRVSCVPSEKIGQNGV